MKDGNGQISDAAKTTLQNPSAKTALSNQIEVTEPILNKRLDQAFGVNDELKQMAKDRINLETAIRISQIDD